MVIFQGPPDFDSLCEKRFLVIVVPKNILAMDLGMFLELRNSLKNREFWEINRKQISIAFSCIPSDMKY